MRDGNPHLRYVSFFVPLCASYFCQVVLGQNCVIAAFDRVDGFWDLDQLRLTVKWTAGGELHVVDKEVARSIFIIPDDKFDEGILIDE